MKITEIKKQERRSERYSIYADGKYAFSLSEWQLAGSGLKVGLEVSESELADFKENSEFGKLYDRTLRWFSLRPRSRREFEDYLRHKTKDDNLQQRVRRKIDEGSYLDDEKFARSWIEDRRLNKQVSQRRLRQELRVKGVDSETIDAVLAEDETDDVDVARAVIAKKRHLSRYQDELKLKQYLARQGFSYDTIKKALGE